MPATRRSRRLQGDAEQLSMPCCSRRASRRRNGDSEDVHTSNSLLQTQLPTREFSLPPDFATNSDMNGLVANMNNFFSGANSVINDLRLSINAHNQSPQGQGSTVRCPPSAAAGAPSQLQGSRPERSSAACDTNSNSIVGTVDGQVLQGQQSGSSNPIRIITGD